MGMKRFTNALKITTMAVAAASLMATSAIATDGMFGNGTGARNKALAGAGVANEKDATAISLNPAGLVHSEDQLNVAASLFSPLRGYKESGGAGINTDVSSDSNYFVIPNIAYSHRIDANTVFGLSMYGNGGMNTDYNYNGLNGIGGGSTGNPFGTGTTNYGIDLTQVFISAAVAKQYGNFAIGIAPILSLQIFDSDGLSAFGASDLQEEAFGIAVRGGVEWAVTPNFRVGVAGVTPTYMQKFNGYEGFFNAGNGVLEIPATVQAGIALDVMPNMTVMADYKRIFYSNSREIAAAGNIAKYGFGWNSINIYKIGLEWEVVDDIKIRAGYSYNDSPIKSDAVSLGALAPGVVKHHITAGVEMELTESMNLELAAMYAPENTVTGPGVTPFGALGTTIEDRMSQWELTAGIKWKLGEDDD
ncbi:MAG: outer membrane protein transport protein [Hyphomicrobiaceae bacterium]|nr:outer membrane protein transport protein [Hyphomicrobiaceae bacterium]